MLDSRIRTVGGRRLEERVVPGPQPGKDNGGPHPTKDRRLAGDQDKAATVSLLGALSAAGQVTGSPCTDRCPDQPTRSDR